MKQGNAGGRSNRQSLPGGTVCIGQTCSQNGKMDQDMNQGNAAGKTNRQSLPGGMHRTNMQHQPSPRNSNNDFRDGSRLTSEAVSSSSCFPLSLPDPTPAGRKRTGEVSVHLAGYHCIQTLPDRLEKPRDCLSSRSSSQLCFSVFP